jgi:hypothetical protein
MLRIGLWLTQGSGESLTSESFTQYIDSVTGNDADNGTTPALADQNLSAATWTGTTGFAYGGSWSGYIMPTSSNRIGPFTGPTPSTVPPVIDGSQVLANNLFSLSAATGNGGVVYEVTVTPPGGQSQDYTPFTMTNGVIDTRVITSVANLAAATGPAFYVPTAQRNPGTTTPFIIYYKAAGGVSPTTQGAVISWSRYSAPIEYHDRTGATIVGMHARVGSSVLGIINAGRSARVVRCLASYASKHNFIISSGLIEDCVGFDAEAGRTVLGDGIIPYTFYDQTVAGLTVESRRCMMIMPPSRPKLAQALYAHSSDVTVHANVNVKGFVSYRGGYVGVLATDQLYEDCVSIDNAAAIQAGGSATNVVIRRAVVKAPVTAAQTVYVPSVGSLDGGSVLIEDCAIFVETGAATGTAIAVFRDKPSIIRRNTIAMAGGNTNVLVNSVSTQVCQVMNNIFTKSLAVGSLNWLSCRTKDLVDYNVYCQVDSTARYWRDSTTGVNHLSLAAWKAAGFDAHSVELNLAQTNDLFLNGVAGLALGDFRLNPAYAGPNFTDGTPIVGNAGPSTYLDWNTRTVSAGQPAQWPTPPLTEASCKTYIDDPEAWEWYATAPEAFGSGDWSIAPGDTIATVTITNLPVSTTDIEYRIDGGAWTSSAGIVSFVISGLTNAVEYDVELRAVNSAGNSAASDLKSVTPVGVSLAALMLTGETDGVAINFLDDYFFASTGFYGSARVKDVATPANEYDSHPYGLLTYTSPAPKLTRQSDGLFKYTRHNLYLNSGAPANQSITVLGSATYAVTITGSVSVTASGAATGTWTAGTQTFTAATGTLTLGSTSGAGTVHVYRTPNASATYLATTGAIRYALPYEWAVGGAMNGVLLEELRQNSALWGSDFTNAVWTKTTMTTAKTATGPDGVANSASTLTASAGNATALQTTVLGSAARTVACFMKRRTGSGTVELTMNGGSNWSSVTVPTDWGLVQMASATSSNPTIGIRIVTNADAIDVAWFTLEDGANITSPIETFGASVQRAADSLTLGTSAFPLSATLGTITAQAKAPPATSALHGGNGPTVYSLDNGTSSEVACIIRTATTNAANGRVDDGGATQATITVGTWNNDAVGRHALAFASNDFQFAFDGTLGTADSSGTLPTVTTMRFGGRGTAASGFMNGHRQTVRYLPRRASNAELQTFTTP